LTNRLTKFEKNPNSNFPYKLKDESLCTELDSIYMLGQIEDLMEKYGINSIKELEQRLDSANQVVHELLGYKQLEEQIGCPLEVIFKALTNGFKFIVSNHKLGTLNQRVNQMIYCDYAYLYYPNDVKEWCISTINDYFYLKDYQKTWWLKEDKSE
jgi:hypothetical protein